LRGHDGYELVEVGDVPECAVALERLAEDLERAKGPIDRSSCSISGAVETGALTVYRRTSIIAATAADLTALLNRGAVSDLQDIETASSRILTPYSTSPLTIWLSAVVADASKPIRARLVPGFRPSYRPSRRAAA
jgi:hypothetical protein